MFHSGAKAWLWNTTLQNITLCDNYIGFTGFGVLLDMMEHMSHISHHITDLELRQNSIRNEGASLLARSLGNNASPNLTCLSLSQYGIGDDCFIALVSALKQNTSLLQLALSRSPGLIERAFLVLAESLPEIRLLERVHFSKCVGLTSAMPLLLAALRKNTSLFRVNVTGCAPYFVPHTPEETARFDGGWMEEMGRLEHRIRFLTFIRKSEETDRPRGVWPCAVARVATFPAIIFEVLRSKPTLVPSRNEGA
jgi:hypothetical protein